MDLKTYLKTSNKTQDEFAIEVGVSQGLVSQWLNRVTAITPERAIDIEKATKGKVSKRELRPDIFEMRA